MQSAAERPEPTVQRKAAIVTGAATDHAGKVEVRPIANFDLNRTIFQTLEGGLTRSIMAARVGKEVVWKPSPGSSFSDAYTELRDGETLPDIRPSLLTFMVDECDFDVEHADGSFLDHLYFCFEYSAKHYPDHSAIVMLTHSILGTGTNTFAMTADKIPALREHLTDFEWRHIEAFPSVLRLLYDLPLREELRANLHRLDELSSISMRRVIDNEPIELSADDFWIQMNYQLIHLLDFLPVANWRHHQNETSFIVFRDLYDLLERAGKRDAKLEYTEGSGASGIQGERRTMTGVIADLLPVGLSERMAARSVRRFSERIGHDISYALTWK
ncbi:MAG: hypothetical protein AAGA48_27490 [Myxococcota bacterium]